MSLVILVMQPILLPTGNPIFSNNKRAEIKSVDETRMAGRVMAGQTTYEIYTLANGRWLVDARYKGSQRDGAIEEAKRLSAQAGIEQVKVGRETFDENDGLQKETTVFKSEPKGGAASKASAGTGFDPFSKVNTAKLRPNERRRPAGNRTEFRGRRTPRRSPAAPTRTEISAPVRLAYKMFIIGLLSFAFATTMTLLYNQTLLS